MGIHFSGALSPMTHFVSRLIRQATGSNVPTIHNQVRRCNMSSSSFPIAASAPIGIKPIQLYSLATPNGQKVSILLEELGIEYDAHKVTIHGEQFTEWFKAINPNSKIPAITDLNGPEGKPFHLFESGAILLYLADKYGKFIAKDGEQRWTTIQWVFWQMSGLGPMLGQNGHFWLYASEDVPYAKQRFLTESLRLFGVLDKQLATTGAYVAGSEYTIADISMIGWVHAALSRLAKHFDVAEFPHVQRWRENVLARSAVQRGLKVCE